MEGKESRVHKTSQTITRHLKRSKFSGKYADFKIIVGNKLFPTHRFILGNKSTYFRDYLQQTDGKKAPESREYTEYTADAISVCLEYIYTDRLDIKSANAAAAVSLVGHHWNLKYVVAKCEQLLKNNTTAKNCIQMRVLATMIGLVELGEAANKVILGNFESVSKAKDLQLLSMYDIKVITDTALERASVRIKDLWTIYEAWHTAKSATGDRDVICDTLAIIPFGQFTVNGFKKHVWINQHVSQCDKCKKTSAHIFLQSVNDILRGDDVIFLLKLAKTYQFHFLHEMVHQHIVQYHVEVFTSREMDDMECDDLMSCIYDINDMCTPGEFTAIVKWMEKDSSRQEIFPQIFKCVEDPTATSQSAFLTSFCGFFGFSEPTAKEALCADVDDQYWWPKHCLFLKAIARKYSCDVTEKFVDQCIIGGFESISQDEGFLELTEFDLTKYLSAKSTYASDKVEIWEAVMRWIRHKESRKLSFQKIFDSIRLDEFDTGFLKSEILMNEFVMDSKTCLFSIVREMMGRMEVLEQKYATLRH